MITRRGFLKLAATAFASAAAVLGYGTVAEAMGTPRIRNYTFTPPRWTPGLKLRLVLLSDIHTTKRWMELDRVAGICETVNGLGGDMILLLGDFVNGMDQLGVPLPNDDIASCLKTLSAPLGTYAILGNHDYWHSEDFELDPRMMPKIGKAFEKVGIPLLINDATRLAKDGKPFWLAGLGDQLAFRLVRRPDGKEKEGVDDLPATLAKVTDDAPLILMAHEPDIFPEVPDRVSLTLSGHTHGGQVNLFGWSPAMNSRYGTRYRGGHIVENGRHIVVSRGLGCTTIPLRLGAWPEIVVLDIG
ncbi:MAG TPA: metallophosphoesterase [Ensifer sp.]|nr:metallophosphoesterase [Ensifer sp.]